MTAEKTRWNCLYTSEELQRLRCMWLMGVPSQVIIQNLNRLGTMSVTTKARKSGWLRPDWHRSWRAQLQHAKKRIP